MKTTSQQMKGAKTSTHDFMTDISILSIADYLAGTDRINLRISSFEGG